MNNIGTENSFSTTSWSTPNDAAHRLYQDLLYFQNVIQFQGTYLIVISFKLIQKVLPLHNSFPQNSQCYETRIV
jgi:hypothetical protein